MGSDSEIELCVYGREGQGVSLCTYILGNSIVVEGRYVQMRPEWGDRGTGKPIKSILRINNAPIRDYSETYKFDVVAVLDPTLTDLPDYVSLISSARSDFRAIINSRESVEGAICADMSSIARKYGSRVSVVMAGALAGSLGVSSLDSIVTSVKSVLGDARNNVKAVKKGYEILSRAGQ